MVAKSGYCFFECRAWLHFCWNIFSPAILFSAFSVTCIGDIFRPSLDMLCRWLKDRLTVKLAIVPVVR